MRESESAVHRDCMVFHSSALVAPCTAVAHIHTCSTYLRMQFRITLLFRVSQCASFNVLSASSQTGGGSVKSAWS